MRIQPNTSILLSGRATEISYDLPRLSGPGLDSTEYRYLLGIEWDVTANTDADRQFLAKYDVFGPPTFLLFDESGVRLKEQTIVGYLPADDIVATLTEVFELPTEFAFAECRANESAVKARTWGELTGRSYEYLYGKQEALEANFRLTEYDRWDIDQDKRTLTLSIGNVPVVEANIAIVGTFIPAHGLWQWSWATPSVDEKLSAPIDVVRQYGVEHHLDKLTDRGWRAEEVDSLEMAAIANYLLQGQGIYGAAAGDLRVFVVITDIRKVD